jgi:predicted unusual protein kinase regulating ubiquinone biosynthesis (AarF/ABC1/UbiB family)
MDHIAKEYKLILPPYFTLVLRAFSTIEGIALKVTPKLLFSASCSTCELSWHALSGSWQSCAAVLGLS